MTTWLTAIRERHALSSPGPYNARWTEDRILREQAVAHNDRGTLLTEYDCAMRALKAAIPHLEEHWRYLRDIQADAGKINAAYTVYGLVRGAADDFKV